jgi:hypothetical protein
MTEARTKEAAVADGRPGGNGMPDWITAWRPTTATPVPAGATVQPGPAVDSLAGLDVRQADPQDLGGLQDWCEVDASVVARTVRGRAAIAARKHQQVRRATTLLLASMTPLVIAVITTTVGAHS